MIQMVITLIQKGKTSLVDTMMTISFTIQERRTSMSLKTKSLMKMTMMMNS